MEAFLLHLCVCLFPCLKYEWVSQCKERCEKEEDFACRGYTYKVPPESQYGDNICYLHSDDTLTASPMVPDRGATYIEKLMCIDCKYVRSFYERCNTVYGVEE